MKKCGKYSRFPAAEWRNIQFLAEKQKEPAEAVPVPDG